MAFSLWLAFGVIAGFVVKPLMPGRDLAAFLLAPILGVKGAVLGGCLGTLLDWGDLATFDFRTLLFAMAGGVLLLAAYRAAVGPEWRRLLLGRTTWEK